ncbi:hypothetical protein L1887_17367 [Cichorium endivia]|nr:hypothetical protein L1887_17367 [Cichorium endivia]
MVIKMPSSDVSADMCSSESLSLTGLVCTQEQYSKSQPPKTPHHPPRHHRKTTKISENDINFEFSYTAKSPKESQVHGNLTMRDILEPRKSGGKTRGISGKKEIGKYGNKEEKNGGFGHKIVQSITTPCRSCSAVEPSAVVKKTNIVNEI